MLLNFSVQMGTGVLTLEWAVNYFIGCILLKSKHQISFGIFFNFSSNEESPAQKTLAKPPWISGFSLFFGWKNLNILSALSKNLVFASR